MISDGPQKVDSIKWVWKLNEWFKLDNHYNVKYTIATNIMMSKISHTGMDNIHRILQNVKKTKFSWSPDK